MLHAHILSEGYAARASSLPMYDAVRYVTLYHVFSCPLRFAYTIMCTLVDNYQLFNKVCSPEQYQGMQSTGILQSRFYQWLLKMRVLCVATLTGAAVEYPHR